MNYLINLIKMFRIDLFTKLNRGKRKMIVVLLIGVLLSIIGIIGAFVAENFYN